MSIEVFKKDLDRNGAILYPFASKFVWRWNHLEFGILMFDSKLIWNQKAQKGFKVGKSYHFEQLRKIRMNINVDLV